MNRRPMIGLGVPLPRRDFYPAFVSDTAAWYSPRIGLTLASGVVSSWTTTTGAFAASQAVAGARPTPTNGINGRPSLLFARASTQSLAHSAANLLSAGATRYVIAVAKASDLTGGTICSFRLNKTGGAFWGLLAHEIAGNFYYFTDGIAVANSEATAGAPDMTQPSLIEWELTVGAKPVVRVNGIARTVGGGNIVTEAGTQGFIIGQRDGGVGIYDGNISDIYIAAGIPAADIKSNLRAYFALANGITL